MRSKTTSEAQTKVLKKFFEKSCKKIWKFEKLALPLHPLSPQKRKQRSEKKSLKNLAKRFGGYEKRFYLCTTFRYEKAVKRGGSKERSDEQEMFL